MNHDSAGSSHLPAPCLVDHGIVVNKTDMLRLLNDLGQVAYTDIHAEDVMSKGTGYIMDSFDYIHLEKLPSDQACFRLVQENRCLQLVPLTTPIKEQATRNIDPVDLEAIVAEALSASWDACLDDDGPLA